MAPVHFFSCLRCRTTLHSTAAQCCLCANTDARWLTERVRLMLRLKRSTEALRAVEHGRQLAQAGAV